MAQCGPRHVRDDILPATVLGVLIAHGEEVFEDRAVRRDSGCAARVRGVDLPQEGITALFPEQRQSHAQPSSSYAQAIIDQGTVYREDYRGDVTVDIEYTTSVHDNNGKMEGMHVRLTTLSTLK